jgi:hypothetical protein
MLIVEKGVGRIGPCGRSASLGRALIALFFTFPLIAGCETVPSHQYGPTRAISLDEDINSLRPMALLTDNNMDVIGRANATSQADIRNQIITARMYLIDIEYNRYEARLTAEIQDEGLSATVASLALTTSASLIPVEQTTRILSGIATGVTGLDKAYTDKELLNNTMQALQTQMRADRKQQAAAIYSKMFIQGNNGIVGITPIGSYTLAMALSDVDHYYDAGTISSALVGLSKTVSNAEQNADSAKDAAGPNPAQVGAAKATATPLSGPVTVPAINPGPPVLGTSQALLTKSSQIIHPLPPAGPGTSNLFSATEKALSSADAVAMLHALCVPTTNSALDFGPLNSPGRIAIVQFKAGTTNASQPPQGADIVQKANKPDQAIPSSTMPYLRQAVQIDKADTTNSHCSLPDPAFAIGEKAAATLGQAAQ